MRKETVAYISPIHVVIPVFNGWEQTKVCLDALRASTYKNLEIIVVDHGSTDETMNTLPAQYPEVKHVLGDSFLWWSGATNLGIRKAISSGAESIMLLNNDCYVAPKAIETLVRHIKRTDEAIIAPVQKDYYTDKTICTTCRECFLLGFPTLPSYTVEKDKHIDGALIKARLISGGRGVIIPVDVFRRIGLLDEVYLPHYGADHDFFLRCRKQGVRLYVALDSIVYIDESRTSLAVRSHEMTLREFLQSLFSTRSHRNLRDLRVLFKKHYPIKGLYNIGVALNIIRYFLVYIWRRVMSRVSH